ncbi:MAG: FecR family protein [Flavisolibacter sp.]
MDKSFNTIEDVIADDHFFAWYSQNDLVKANEWEGWLSLNPQFAPLVQLSIDWLNGSKLAENEPSIQQVEEAHQKLISSLNRRRIVPMKRLVTLWWVSAAAAVLILLVSGFWLWNINSKKILNNGYGSISLFQLPDGSHVTLNANSKITIKKAWEKNTDREVWLQGEAFFKVQKTPNKNRFIVHANTMDIIVTGTQFNVIAREDESSVLLTEGSVTIRTSNGKEIKMKPGDFVKVENEIPARQMVDQQRVLAWKESKLDFDNTPIREVAKIISRDYGVKVTLADKSIGDSTISGIMPNDNLDVLIQALEATGDYKITKSNGEIIISGP